MPPLFQPPQRLAAQHLRHVFGLFMRLRAERRDVDGTAHSVETTGGSALTLVHSDWCDSPS